MTSLSDVVCRHAKAKSKTYRLSDTENLYLEIRPSGNKFWRMRYTFDGKPNTSTLGEYPYITLLEARNAAAEQRTLLKRGIDPNGEKREEAERVAKEKSETFEEIIRDYHSHFIDNWTATTAEVIIRRFEIYLFPHIGGEPFRTLTRQQMLEALQRVEVLSPNIAERLLKHTSKAYDYASLKRGGEFDPTIGVKNSLKKYKRGNYKAVDIDELGDLLAAIESNRQRFDKQTYYATQLLMLTAVRTNELINARWQEINLDKAMWIIPASRMKMGLVHMVPLSRQVLKILRELKIANSHSEYVLPRKDDPQKTISDITVIRLLERIGYKGKMTGHGFRSVFMGIAKEKLKFAHDIPDRQLAHVPSGLNGKAYDRAKYLTERTDLMQKYADYIELINQPKGAQTNVRDTLNFTYNWNNYRTAIRYGTDLFNIQQY
jgi:integrase